MNDRNLMRVLRAVQALDVQDAPKQHRLRTPQCPPLTHFPVGMRKGWQPEEREHVTGCAYCQRVTALAWRAECPSLFPLALYLEDMCLDQRAMEFHLEKDRCARCRRLHQSLLFKEMAAPLRMGQRGIEQVRRQMEGAVTGSAALLAPGGKCDTGPARQPFQLTAARADGSLTVTLRETPQGNLALYVKTPDRTLAGHQVRVTILGQREVLPPVDLKLELWEGGCDAQHTLGLFRDLAPCLGADCVLLATMVEGLPGEQPDRPQNKPLHAWSTWVHVRQLEQEGLNKTLTAVYWG
jgi:hypothetical protein